MAEANPKILIFSMAYFPFVGGAEVAIQEIAKRLPGWEFNLITLRFDKNLPRREKQGNVTIHRLGFGQKQPKMKDLNSYPLKLNKYFFPFLAWHYARRLCRQENYAGIWSMMAAYAGFGAMFFKLSQPQIPYLLTLQEGDPFEYILKKVRFVRPFFYLIFKKADYLQAISHYLADWGKEMGFKGEPVVVPNGVNYAHFSQKFSEEEKEKLKKELDKTKDDFYLITTSRLVVKNGLADVIKSLPLLPKEVKFLILGTGPLEEELKELAQEQGVADRVKFLGFVAHDRLPLYLQISDAFIRPSLSEGMGNSFLEAMAARLPVIATPVGGIVDFLFPPEKSDKPTGLFCQVNDPSSIAQAVKILLKDPDLKQQLIKNAEEMVRREYEWDYIAQRMEKIFSQMRQDAQKNLAKK